MENEKIIKEIIDEIDLKKSVRENSRRLMDMGYEEEEVKKALSFVDNENKFTSVEPEKDSGNSSVLGYIFIVIGIIRLYKYFTYDQSGFTLFTVITAFCLGFIMIFNKEG